LRYDGDLRVPAGFSEKEREEIKDTVREIEHQFAFVDVYGEGALEVWKKVSEERGLKKGRYLIEKYGITGSDLSSVKRLIEAYVYDDPERTTKPDIRLEGDCRAVNPKVNHKNSKWRAKGDEVCQEIFWIEG
jgi:hypothetical protein